LQLAHARAVDIAAAAERIQVAAAVLDQARALWLPTITVGGDYFQHGGPVQDVSNAVFNDTHNSLMLGAGTGIGPAAVFTVTDAVFAPLVAKQQLLAGEAKLQAAANDTLVAVTDAYFTVQQARGELAGFVDATRRMEDVVARTRNLAPAIVPEFELLRAEAELARRQQAELTARERWKVASADLVRLLRLDTAIQVEPLEPAHLRISLIDVHKPLEELLPIALTSRPELASQQAQIQATLAELKQERWRPLLPSLVVRGASTPGSTLAVGGFLPSPNSNVSGLRGDVDVQLLWQLNNLGFGNAALVQQREAENRLALVDMTRIQDQVAAEVSQTHAQAQLAARRVEVAEGGIRAAKLSVEANLTALGQTKGAGNLTVTLVRPQEVVAAIQALAQAYSDYYTAVADSNRAQFRLYRALGQPAQCLAQDDTMLSSSAR
jgi:outer membrane protein TolC